MSYQIPDEIIELYAELEEAFQAALDRGAREIANSINSQKGWIAMAQLGKAMDELKARAKEYEQEQVDTARTLGEGE